MTVLMDREASLDFSMSNSFPGDLRHEVKERLLSVMQGSPPGPLSSKEARAMSQVTFAAIREGLVFGPPVANVLAPAFQALLAHQDLKSHDLEWIAEDKTVSHPSVLAALFSHPSCSLDVLFRAIRHTLWSIRGAVDNDDLAFTHPLVQVLRGANPKNGPAIALLLALWADDNFSSFVLSAFSLCEHPGSCEILATLAADHRQERGYRRFSIPSTELMELVEKATLLSTSTVTL